MAKTSGGTLTVFLVILFVLLASVTSISVFFFLQESDERESAQHNLEQMKIKYENMENHLKDIEKERMVFEQKLKEAEAEIDRLEKDADYQEGLTEKFKKDKQEVETSLAALKKQQESLKTALENQLKEAQDQALELKVQLDAALERNKELEQKWQELQGRNEGLMIKGYGEDPSIGAEPEGALEMGVSGINLDPIVVNPMEAKGAIISVDRETDFVIVRLGAQDGLKDGDILSVYRGDACLGDLKATRVEQDMAAADFVPPFTSQGISETDTVVIKQ